MRPICGKRSSKGCGSGCSSQMHLLLPIVLGARYRHLQFTSRSGFPRIFRTGGIMAKQEVRYIMACHVRHGPSMLAQSTVVLYIHYVQGCQLLDASVLMI